jgi:hypothetical protein
MVLLYETFFGRAIFRKSRVACSLVPHFLAVVFFSQVVADGGAVAAAPELEFTEDAGSIFERGSGFKSGCTDAAQETFPCCFAGETQGDGYNHPRMGDIGSRA